jgi:hypothetical protein
LIANRGAGLQFELATMIETANANSHNRCKHIGLVYGNLLTFDTKLLCKGMIADLIVDRHSRICKFKIMNIGLLLVSEQVCKCVLN